MSILRLNDERNTIRFEGKHILFRTIYTVVWRCLVYQFWRQKYEQMDRKPQWMGDVAWKRRLGDQTMKSREGSLNLPVLTFLWTVPRAEGWLKEHLLTPNSHISKFFPNLTLCHLGYQQFLWWKREICLCLGAPGQLIIFCSYLHN